MIRFILIIILSIIINGIAETMDQILDKMEANEKSKSSRTEITQLVYAVNGKKRTSKLISLSKDEGDKGLMEYVSPARIKGMKILMLNDGNDIWLYSPRTSRVRKIASHQRKQSVNNSDFSYEDMSASDLREDYHSQLLGNEKLYNKDCYKIQMNPKDDDKTYSKTILWVDKSNYVPLKGEFYDEDKALWKVMTMQDIEKIGKYWTPKKIEMKNVQKGSRTIMLMDKIEYDVPIKDNIFSERNLKK